MKRTGWREGSCKGIPLAPMTTGQRALAAALAVSITLLLIVLPAVLT